MIVIETRTEYWEAIKQANVWSYEYYHLDNPTVEDKVWDTYYNAIQEYEEKYPQHISKFSPTQNVGWSKLLESHRLSLLRYKA